MPISRMQQPRQLYGLGSLVKSVTKAVKNVAKSPIGKAAMLYFAPALIPGGASTMGGVLSNIRSAGGIGSYLLGTAGTGAAAGGGGTLGALGKLGLTKGFGAKALTGRGMLAAFGAPSVLGGMFTAKEQEDIEELRSSGDPEKLKNYLRRYYTNLNPDANTETVEAFVRANAAYGGRMGYDNGGYTFEQFMKDKFQVDQFMGEEQMKKLYEKMMREKKVREQKTMAAEGGRIGFKDGTDENLVGIETLKLGDYDLEGFQKKGRGNTLMFGSDDLKMLSQSLDYGELSNLSNRQKEKIKESILRARAGIINPTELMNEIGMLRLEPDAAAFLKKIIPDETMEKVFFDKEGDARIGVQKANKLLEDVAFGGQKNPKLSSDMYNKLGDEYIKDQKKAIQREIDFNKKYGEANFLNFKDGGRIGYARGTDDIVDQASGIMGLPQRINKAGVKELDLRESGGFIPPVGVKEKADDIPAMLSNNEFVFTADAVRGMGDGNVNLGAQRMYDMMKKLEDGGRA